jgi:anti-sigma regulatory factor (Ser/Thr protein kinase)
LEISVRAVSTELAVVRRTLQAWLGAQAVPVELLTDILLVVDEAAANSVEHGYHDQPAGPVTISAQRFGDPTDHVLVSIADQGRWREPAPDPAHHRGRGLGIMHALTTSIDIRVEAGTMVRARFDPGSPG